MRQSLGSLNTPVVDGHQRKCMLLSVENTMSRIRTARQAAERLHLCNHVIVRQQEVLQTKLQLEGGGGTCGGRRRLLERHEAMAIRPSGQGLEERRGNDEESTQG